MKLDDYRTASIKDHHTFTQALCELLEGEVEFMAISEKSDKAKWEIANIGQSAAWSAVCTVIDTYVARRIVQALDDAKDSAGVRS